MQSLEPRFDPMDTLDDDEEPDSSDTDTDEEDEAGFGIEAGVPPPLASTSMFAAPGSPGAAPLPRISPGSLWDKAVSSSVSASKVASKVSRRAGRLWIFGGKRGGTQLGRAGWRSVPAFRWRAR